jgi:hypothetical protein
VNAGSRGRVAFLILQAGFCRRREISFFVRLRQLLSRNTKELLWLGNVWASRLGASRSRPPCTSCVVGRSVTIDIETLSTG